MGLIQDLTDVVNKYMPSSPTASSSQHPTKQPATDPINETAINNKRTSARQGPVSILCVSYRVEFEVSLNKDSVLGRSGAGKTYFIDHIRTPSSEWRDNAPTYEKTMDVVSERMTLSAVKFKLIDTPGFDNLALSDIEVFTKIINYLSCPPTTDQGIHGIIYIHPAGESLQSRALLRTVTLLSNLLVGEDEFSRLTIFVSQIGPRRMDPEAIADELRRRGSAFGAACARGAKIVTPSSSRPAFKKAVISYASRDPLILPIQQYALQNSPHETMARLEDSMWYFEEDSAHQRLKDLEHRYDSKIQELRLQSKEQERQLNQCLAAYDEVEKHRVSQQETEAVLRQQLRQVQQEYASLRSQLQLQDNSEQSEIVQELKDLNREIDEIGRLISAHLTDNFVRAAFDKDPADVTALDAYDLPSLKKLFGHTGGSSSLIASAEGVGMDIESFLDFSVRIFLCTFLSTKIFRPFHPAIRSSQSTALLAAYTDIQSREPQSAAGKWRSSTFKSIYKPESSDSTTRTLNALTHEFLNDYLASLITTFLGRNDVTLEMQHFDRLQKLMTRAWDWNSKLKGEVIVLGDFMQIAYFAGSGFDARAMEEFESNPRKPHAKVILGTLALGLNSRRALGGGQPPEENIVLKPLVVTDNMYT